MVATFLYVKGYGPTTYVEHKTPQVGKFVSVKPKEPQRYTRPKGIMEIAYDIGVGRSEAAKEKERAALSELDKLQDRRNPEPETPTFTSMVSLARNALGMAQQHGVATGPTMFDPYINEQRRTEPSYDAIDRLSRRGAP